MPLCDLTEFYKLSSALHYNLSATSANRYNILMFIIGKKQLSEDEKTDREKKGILMEALNFLIGVYNSKRRRLGPMAVLHPLRAAAMLARVHETAGLVDLLSILFHDILEDIGPEDIGLLEWKDREWTLYNLLERLEPNEERMLTERLVNLTLHPNETYYEYIERFIDLSGGSADTVRIKLADRLDNTLDMRIELHDAFEPADFFKYMFQLLFVDTYRGLEPAAFQPTAALNDAGRLYQLFKNAVLLSLIRRKCNISEDMAAAVLFEAVCEASLNEAQRNFIQHVGHHLKSAEAQRELLLNAMKDCRRSDVDCDAPHDLKMLNDLFGADFSRLPRRKRTQKLEGLYRDKPLMSKASIAFVVIFLNFLNDPEYFYRGLDAGGK